MLLQMNSQLCENNNNVQMYIPPQSMGETDSKQHANTSGTKRKKGRIIVLVIKTPNAR